MEEYLYSAFVQRLKALRHGSQFYLQITPCLPGVPVADVMLCVSLQHRQKISLI